MKNSKLALLGASVALVLSCVASATAASASAGWVERYYQNPQPDEVVPSVRALSRGGYFEAAGQPATAIGFLSAIFAQNPDRVDGWMAEFRSLPESHRRVVAAALWYSGLPAGADALRNLAVDASPELQADVASLLAQGAPSVRGTPVLSESSLNLQWGAFLASGDQQHIVNVLAALGSGESALSSKARFALAQKASEHRRVYEICQAEIARQPAGVRDQMQAALAGVQRN